MEKINDTRVRLCLVMFLILISLLMVRLAYIQIICHESYETAAISQYEISIEGLDTRGLILDRNSMPLTDGTNQFYYIIDRTLMDDDLKKAMESIEAMQVASEKSSYMVYQTERYDRDVSDQLKEKYNAYIFRASARYSDDQPACHLIGYLNKDSEEGVSGLELMFEDILAPEGNNLVIYADAAGDIIAGRAPEIRSESEDTKGQDTMDERYVITSIDRRIQYVCEKALADHAESGAALVTDCDTGEILGWACAPCFDPDNVEAYLDSGDCLINKVSQAAYAPGSVFKIVTAAAALENGICDIDQTFTCEGQVTVGGVTLGCSGAPLGGHGKLTMSEAMACSCNCYFAQLGEMVGSENIVRQARYMGLGSTVLEGFPEETAGNIPEEDEVGPWDVSNLSIGQGSILATPLQINRMTAVVASGGRLIDYSVVKQESDTEGIRIISLKTAAHLEKMMRAVTERGTGFSDREYTVWGKTGTAETRINDVKSNTCWFTGYCRIADKTYVITVMTEDGSSGTADAMPVFDDIADFLVNLQK